MKQWIANTLFISLIGSVAFAGKINLDARTDFESYSTNKAMGKPAYSIFKINRLKVDFQGTLGEANSYRVRIDPLRVGDANTTKTKRDSTSPYVDFGFITHKISDEWNVSMGKIITGMGGAEGLNNPGDMYLRSVAGDEAAAIYWPTGVQIQGLFGDQKLNINVANISEDVTDATASANLNSTSHLYGFSYLGKLNEGNILPSISYHTETFNNTNYTKKTQSYAALGARFLISDFEIEVDALNNSRKFDPKGAEKMGDVTSGVALVRYKLDAGSVHIKYENSSVKIPTGVDIFSKSTITGATLAYEFKPVKDENWRWHIAGTQKDTKPEVGDTKSEKKILVGMRIMADFLK